MADSTLTLQAQSALMAGAKAPNAGPTQDIARARQVAQDFEAFFLGQMLQPMFAGIDTDGPLGGGGSEKLWRSMQVTEYGNAMARAGGIGIADAVLREMLAAQEIR
jgi:Rod binding domain-containing protein